MVEQARRYDAGLVLMSTEAQARRLSHGARWSRVHRRMSNVAAGMRVNVALTPLQDES
jgi:hypothetical protein